VLKISHARRIFGIVFVAAAANAAPHPEHQTFPDTSHSLPETKYQHHETYLFGGHETPCRRVRGAAIVVDEI
jgi:hypothetical protein